MSEILDRLTRQLAARGIEDAKGMAETRLRDYGILDHKGELTQYGRERDAMTAGERAIDRASRRSGKAPSKYEYHPASNRAILRRG